MEVEDQRLREGDLLVVERLRLQADAARRDGVRTADLEVLDAIAAILASLRPNRVTGGAVANDDLDGGERLTRVVRHTTGDGAGSDALSSEPTWENADEGDSSAQHPTRDSHNVCASGLKSCAINGAVDSAGGGAEPNRGNGERGNAPKPGRVVTVRSLCGSVVKRAVRRKQTGTTAMDRMYSLPRPSARTLSLPFLTRKPRVTELQNRGAWHTRNDLSEGARRHCSTTRYVGAQLPAKPTIRGPGLDVARGGL